MRDKYRRGLLFSTDVEKLLKDVPKGKITETIEVAIRLYFNGDMSMIEEGYKNALDKKDRANAEYLVWKDRYDRARAEEDAKVRTILREWGLNKNNKPTVREGELDEPMPLMLKFNIHRTRREVLAVLEGME